MALIRFLVTPAGRLLRIVAGLALIVIGLAVVKDTGGLVLAAIGLVPLLAGLFDVCLFSWLFGGAFSGKAMRTRFGKS